MRLLASLLLASTIAACATTGEYDTDEIEVTDGKADVVGGELKLRTGETSVWVTKELVRREGANGPEFAMKGRASRNVNGGLGFVMDDPYGDFAKKTARTWEVTWPANYVAGLADGVNQFVRLDFVHSNGRPDSLTLRAQVRPRLLSFTGSSKIYLTAELTPVVNGGRTVYRLKGKTTTDNASLVVTVGTQALTDVVRTSSNEFQIDLAPETVFEDSPIEISAVLATGTKVSKTTHLGLSIKKLGLTSEDPYELWPRPTCTTAKKSCLTGLGDGALDLAACGEAIEVNACRGQVGVFVDDVAFVAALNEGRARTATAAFKADAVALVGADRADQLQYGAEQSIEARLQPQFGRWYLGTASRGAALTKAVDAGMLDAYARPMDLVEPHAPVPGNASASRQVAADALLAYLSTQHFESTEFGRPYEVLVATYRAQHVASIRAFRETNAVEPHPGMSGADVIVGDWIGAYTEVTIDRASGLATNVYLEID
ncbi:MAG: hypothetical protein AB7L94_35295 [Kofleriaceae bacterium]